MSALSFIRTLTVQEFKAEKKTAYIEVKENHKKAGSFFMVNSAGSVIGAVSKKITEGLYKPVVSEVSDESGEHFFLLHNKGEGGAKTIASFLVAIS